MSYRWDFGAEITSYIMNFLVQTFSNIASSFIRLFGKRPKDPHEKAKKAESEAKNPPVNEQLLSAQPHGVHFGTQNKQYVIKPEDMDGHILVCGIPGSGKSTCIAIPTLRNWKGSIFAIDIKGELYENTKKYRRQNIKLFDPKNFDPKNKENTYSYDPFVFLNESTNIAQEARAIAEAIIPLPHDAKEPFWIKSAQMLLTGAILHFHDEKKTFIETLKNIQMFKPKELITFIAESRCEKAVLCVKSLTDIDGKVLAGIATEMSCGIINIVTDDDIVAALTPQEGHEPITPADLQSGSDIYIKVPLNLIDQWKPFLTLIVNQFISFFKRRSESPDNRPILCMLDEFPLIGKIPAVTDTLPVIRSKKVTICLIIQSIAQLKLIYGHDAQEVIADTCAFKAVLGATDPSTQEYFSKLVGTYEKTLGGGSQGSDPYLGAPTGSSKSYSEGNERRSIKPEEFATLRNELILLYPLPYNFCRVRKLPYYPPAK
jgi:type IV secretion system protein VirD4